MPLLCKPYNTLIELERSVVEKWTWFASSILFLFKNSLVQGFPSFIMPSNHSSLNSNSLLGFLISIYIRLKLLKVSFNFYSYRLNTTIRKSKMCSKKHLYYDINSILYACMYLGIYVIGFKNLTRYIIIRTDLYCATTTAWSRSWGSSVTYSRGLNISNFSFSISFW